MEYKKMALVEPRLLENLQQHQIHQPHHQPHAMLDSKLCELDQAMQDILNQKEVSQEEKLKLYQRSLQKYLLFKDKVEPPAVQLIGDASVQPTSEVTATPPQPKGNLEDKEAIEVEIIQSAPKNLRRKASLLMRKLKQDNNITWNAKGEFVYKGGVVPNTHIHDLVQDVLRKRKTHVPHGWQIFAKALKESNIPQDLVGNHDRWHWMNEEQLKNRATKRLDNLAATASESDVHGHKMRSKSSKHVRWTPYK